MRWNRGLAVVALPLHVSLGVSLVLSVATGCGDEEGSPAVPPSEIVEVEPSSGVELGGDCAEPVTLYVDADEDERGAGGPLEACVASNDRAPRGYSFDSSDCDDGDASVFEIYLEDADGDGVPPEDPVEACGGDEPPEGFARPPPPGIPPDCDDGNSDRFRELFVDADGDGDGDRSEPRCVGATATGLVARPGDCDDTDPDVGFGADC